MNIADYKTAVAQAAFMPSAIRKYLIAIADSLSPQRRQGIADRLKKGQKAAFDIIRAGVASLKR